MPAGRLSKYNKRRSDRICEAIRRGMTKGAAATTAGVSIDSVLDWEKKYANFANAIQLAEQAAEAGFTDVIVRAATVGIRKEKQTRIIKAGGEIIEERFEVAQEPDWHAAKWWLGVRRKKDWGEEIQKQVGDTNSYYLTLIKIVQAQGLMSRVGADLFSDEEEGGGDIILANGHNGSAESNVKK